MIDEIKTVPVNEHYANRYIKFIDSISELKRDIEGEKHHILPKSIFPDHINNKENIILLSYREHLIAHMILRRCFIEPKHKKAMWFAYLYMVDERKEFFSSSLNRRYEKTRLSFAHEWKGKVKFSKEHCLKMSENAKKRTGEKNPFYGRSHTIEVKEKLSKMRQNVSWGSHTDEHKQYMSEALSGIKRSTETKEKISKSHNVVYTCPHCEKSGGRMILRWHFDHCREKL